MAGLDASVQLHRVKGEREAEGRGDSKLDCRVRYDLLYRNPVVPGT